MPSLQLLIIDDEPAIRQILSKVAADAGHTVSIAANGEEGLTRLAKGDIDVALCDRDGKIRLETIEKLLG